MKTLHYPTTYLVWDLETSGLEKETCKILEIGCATVHDGQIVERKSWVLNHGIEIPANITEITGITSELIAAEGKDPKQAMTEFLDILLSNQDGAHLTHNGMRFDIEWLAYHVAKTFGWTVGQHKEFLDTYNACYIFNSDVMFRALRNGIDKAGYYYSQMLIWVKNSVVVGRKDYLPMHEVAAYCWHGRHKMNRPKSKSVIFHPKPASSKLHPTMKPVGLLRKIIPNNTRAGEVVYDPFGGSGSTLIASEQLGRRCYSMELDERYVDVIIKRWEKMTGEKAVKINQSNG